MKQEASIKGRKRSLATEREEGTILSVPLRHPIAFAILYLPAIMAIIAASMIGPFVLFYLLIPSVWCFGVAATILNDIFSGKMRFGGTGWSATIMRGKAPMRYWGTIGIWAAAYLFAIAFPIGYAFQERAKQSTRSEQGVAPGDR